MTNTTKKTSFSNITTGDRKSSEYGTPLDFFEKLNSIFHFELDPCANIERQLPGISRNVTKRDDGLSDFIDWDDNTFINPPFGTKKGEDVRAWITKMQESANTYPHSHYVMLLPARIESNWFQELIFTDYRGILYAVKGRLKFYNPVLNKNNDPHPLGSILYIRAYDLTMDMCAVLKKNIPGVFIEKKWGI